MSSFSCFDSWFHAHWSWNHWTAGGHDQAESQSVKMCHLQSVHRNSRMMEELVILHGILGSTKFTTAGAWLSDSVQSVVDVPYLLHSMGTLLRTQSRLPHQCLAGLLSSWEEGWDLLAFWATVVLPATSEEDKKWQVIFSKNFMLHVGVAHAPSERFAAGEMMQPKTI